MEVEVLPKDKKLVVAKVMLDLNYSATEIARVLKVNRATVYRYGEKFLPEDLRQFATEIETLFSVKQLQLLAKIIKNIEDLVDQTDDLKALISAYELLKRHTPSLYEIYKEKEHQEKWDNLLIT